MLFLTAMPYALHSPVYSDLHIKKSRFIGCVEPCSGRDAAIQRVAELRTLHPNATHVCWALMAGGHSAAHDDGEPGGTAGRPMLEVLRHQDLQGVLATVVRYYGGTPLGAGGLVRAYTDSVAQALLQAEKVPVIVYASLFCEIPYALEGSLRRELASHEATLLEIQHVQNVIAHLRLPQHRLADFKTRLNELAAGRVTWPDGLRS